MKVTGWLAVIANLLAQGWALLVLLGAGIVIGDAALIAASDAILPIVLESIAGAFTLALAIQLLVWNPERKAAPPPRSPGVHYGGMLRRPPIDSTEPMRLCTACRQENVLSARNCAWCGHKLK